MNLVQLANDLEYVPRKELAEMSQDPNSSYPAYLVLSEIQRRTLNDKNFAAMQERPTTTVAEEVVGEFMQPQLAENQSQGLQGGTPQSATPLPDSNISAGLSGVPTAPMQMAAIGGLTGYANTGVTSLPAGSAPYPTDMSVEKLARTLGVNMRNPDGTLKDSAVLDAEMRERFDAYNQPAVGNTSDLPSGSVQTSSGVVLTPRVNSTVQIPPPTDPAEQLSETVPATLGLSQGVTSSIPSEVKIPIPFEVGKVPFEYPVTGVNAPSSNDAYTRTNSNPTEVEDNVSTSIKQYEELNKNEYEKAKFEYVPPKQLLLPEIPVNKRNYFEVSPEDRQRDIDVYSLAGLAKSIGGAKNLSELGMGVSDTALGLTKIKKGFRAEDRDIANLKFADEKATYDMEMERTKIMQGALNADSLAEQNIAFKLLELNYGGSSAERDRRVTLIKNDALLKQIEATNYSNLNPHVTILGNELNTLKEKYPSVRTPEDKERILVLENLLNALLFDATNKAGVNMTGLLQDAGVLLN
jgi:hypothetical protein